MSVGNIRNKLLDIKEENNDVNFRYNTRAIVLFLYSNNLVLFYIKYICYGLYMYYIISYLYLCAKNI